jgi:hypothetical protein
MSLSIGPKAILAKHHASSRPIQPPILNTIRIAGPNVKDRILKEDFTRSRNLLSVLNFSPPPGSQSLVRTG